MSKEPSCKGVLLASAVSAVRAAISRGAIQRALAESRLAAEDLRFLDENVEPTRWYPVRALGGYLELTAVVAGGTSDAIYDKLGEVSFQITRSSGFYQQLDFEEGVLRGGSPYDFKRFARLLASIWGAFYNFSSWRVDLPEEGDRGGSWIGEAHWMDVVVLHPCLCPTTGGFIRAIFERATGSRVRVQCELPSRDHFLFRLCIEAG